MTIFSNWIKALRSGEYDQIEGNLHDGGNGYCCLGVYCEISKRQTKGKWFDTDSCSYFEDDEGYNDEAIPPPGVKNYFADSMNIEFDNAENFFDNLAGANDAGFSFDEIADIIEYCKKHHFNDAKVFELNRFLNNLSLDAYEQSKTYY